ncbi:unnamed protein product (macronuclear) [Paramecium tetraurelia]|uniref:Protein kinase domain-containing protein n=1 Tax=Paramecium tetraurelia TaxID=5888 RepID=A0DFY3_PARTE|nr:uncharacterized protein GSPATT00002078001 [Paramecium tetraurelia]CAK81950.1 unnamed protein product [Paramecium tetraurelia]|eukprot:XP_001449347.1 hypothetical protein (macronuclear) [Paramecium tetraurelia strain d4-2]
MIKITKHLRLRQNYSSILDDQSKFYIKPIEGLEHIDFSGQFLIQKDGKLKNKLLQLSQHILIYSSKKYVNLLNATLLVIFDKNNEIEGLKLIKSGTSLEIYEKPQKLYEYIRKYCIQREISDRYKIIQTLYYGSNATFLKLESSLDPHVVYVAKVYEKQNLISEEQKQSLRKEVQILRTINHHHISNLVEIFEDDELIFLLQEELKGESLQTILERQQRYDENQIKQIMRPLFECVSYLHDNNIFHRDIKPQNIMYRTSPDFTEPCLIDFSLADFWNKNGRYLFTRCGSIGYVAPEVLQDKRYVLNIDVYSLGIVIYVLVTLKHPFEDQDKNRMIQKNYHGKIDFTEVQCSQVLMDLMTKCLETDYTKRLNCKEALKHQFFYNKIPKMLSFKIKDNRKSSIIRTPRSQNKQLSVSKFSNDSGYGVSLSQSPSSIDRDRQFSSRFKQNTLLPEINNFRPKSKYFQTRKSQCDSSTNKIE